MNWDDKFSDRAGRFRESPIRDLGGLPTAPDTLDLIPGAPDPEAFPTTLLGESLTALMATPERRDSALQYGPTEGDPALLEEIRKLMAGIGVICETENILVTNGAQQGIHLVSSALLNAKDRVIMDAEAYPGALEVFALQDAEVGTLESRGPAKMIYTTPTFQNPTGRVLDATARAAILAQAHALDAVVLEDDPYQALRYDGTAEKTLLEMDSAEGGIDSARVAYLGSFSKLIFPGIRLGWIVAPKALIARVAKLKQSEDMQPNAFAQAAMATLLSRGIEDHVTRLQASYRARRDAMETALRTALGNRASWETPKGGFFFWLTLDQGVDARDLALEAAKLGVRFIPGSAFSIDGTGPNNTIRMSFSNVPIDRMQDAADRLAQALDVVSAPVL